MLYRGPDLADIDREHAKTLRLMAHSETIEGGKHLAARFTPGRKEMDECDMTAMAGKGLAPSAQRIGSNGGIGPAVQGSKLAARVPPKPATKAVALMTTVMGLPGRQRVIFPASSSGINRDWRAAEIPDRRQGVPHINDASIGKLPRTSGAIEQVTRQSKATATELSIRGGKKTKYR
jgi:hypothetical protein